MQHHNSAWIVFDFGCHGRAIRFDRLGRPFLDSTITMLVPYRKWMVSSLDAARKEGVTRREVILTGSLKIVSIAKAPNISQRSTLTLLAIEVKLRFYSHFLNLSPGIAVAETIGTSL